MDSYKRMQLVLPYTAGMHWVALAMPNAKQERRPGILTLYKVYPDLVMQLGRFMEVGTISQWSTLTLKEEKLADTERVGVCPACCSGEGRRK